MPSLAADSMNQDSNPDTEIRALLQELWQRHLPSTQERLDLVKSAVEAASAGHLEEAVRAEAQAAAHKLAGNLGMFGHKEAGEVASEIEYILKTYTPTSVPSLVTFEQQLHQLLASYL